MPEPLEFKLVDAFALSPYSGNVAGVILNADGLNDRQMQAIAAELNASETTFVLPPANREAAVQFRWFSPSCEVAFCGHATLAGAHALFESGRFIHALNEPGTILPIETKAGILTIRTEKHPLPDKPYTIWLDMPHCEPKKTPVIVPPLIRHLGLPDDAIDPTIPAVQTQDNDIILAVKELSVLLGMQPSMGDLARYCLKNRIRGVLVTTLNTLSSATVVQSRFFAPAVGVDEDPVTGSVHGPLGLHLLKSGVISLVNGRADFFCAQAKGGGRAGIVRIIITQANETETPHVRIGGCCCATTACGTLHAIPKA